MSPIELLEKELDKLLSAERHSIDAFKEGKIDINLYNQHMKNLKPLITSYQYAIAKLTI